MWRKKLKILAPAGRKRRSRRGTEAATVLLVQKWLAVLPPPGKADLVATGHKMEVTGLRVVLGFALEWMCRDQIAVFPERGGPGRGIGSGCDQPLRGIKSTGDSCSGRLQAPPQPSPPPAVLFDRHQARVTSTNKSTSNLNERHHQCADQITADAGGGSTTSPAAPQTFRRLWPPTSGRKGRSRYCSAPSACRRLPR
jgi:hypothetical protein